MKKLRRRLALWIDPSLRREIKRLPTVYGSTSSGTTGMGPVSYTIWPPR